MSLWDAAALVILFASVALILYLLATCPELATLRGAREEPPAALLRQVQENDIDKADFMFSSVAPLILSAIVRFSHLISSNEERRIYFRLVAWNAREAARQVFRS